MAAYVTLAQAKTHLKIVGDDDNADIALKLDQAEALVLDRCNSTAWWRAVTAVWTQATVPFAVTAATLLILTHLYEHRGDAMEPDEALWCAVEQLIRLHKDPVLA